MKRSRRGFSLIEVMMALVVLAVASTGALTGLIFASKQFRLGQNTSHGTILAERLLQRVRLANKQKIITAAQTYTGGGRPENLVASNSTTATAANPWVPSSATSTVLGNLSDDGSADFSRGTFFTVDGTGIEQRKTLSGITTCSAMLAASYQVAGGVFCREFAITKASMLASATTSGTISATTNAAEVMVRVFRKGEPGIADAQWTVSEVVVQ